MSRMRAIRVNVRDEVWAAAEREAKRTGTTIEVFLTQLIESAVLAGRQGTLQQSFLIADQLNQKGFRDWKRDDLYDG